MTRWKDVMLYEVGKPVRTFPEGFTWGRIQCYPGEVAISPERFLTTVYAVTLCQRIAPWVKVVTADELRNDDGRESAGICFSSPGIIFISVNNLTSLIPIIACHEAWHAIEARLPSNTIQEIEACLGPFFHEGGTYNGKPNERRARAFQHYCGLRIEGLPAPTGSRIYEIFEAVWTGQLAREMEAEWADVA